MYLFENLHGNLVGIVFIGQNVSIQKEKCYVLFWGGEFDYYSTKKKKPHFILSGRIRKTNDLNIFLLK